MSVYYEKENSFSDKVYPVLVGTGELPYITRGNHRVRVVGNQGDDRGVWIGATYDGSMPAHGAGLDSETALAVGRFIVEQAGGAEVSGVLAEVKAERQRQDEKFPGQVLPLGEAFGLHANQRDAILVKATCDIRAFDGELTWADVLTEEFSEALAESDPDGLRAELVQVAAVAVRIIEAIDRGEV